MKNKKIQFIVFFFGLIGCLAYPIILKEFSLINYLTGVVIGLSFPVLFIYIHSLRNIIEEDTSQKELQINFKNFFVNAMYDDFLDKSSNLKIYTQKNKWIYMKSESSYLAVFYHKLNSNNYFTREMNQKIFSELSKEVFGIEVDESTISRYKKDSQNFTYGGYDTFYDDVLSPFGDK